MGPDMITGGIKAGKITQVGPQHQRRACLF